MCCTGGGTHSGPNETMPWSSPFNGPIRIRFALALTDAYPDANLRDYPYMLDGLQEVKTRLTQQNIKFAFRVGDVDNDSSCLCASVPLRETFLSSCPNTRPVGHGG